VGGCPEPHQKSVHVGREVVVVPLDSASLPFYVWCAGLIKGNLPRSRDLGRDLVTGGTPEHGGGRVCEDLHPRSIGGPISPSVLVSCSYPHPHSLRTSIQRPLRERPDM